jgi:predicted Kef-type K+ transport protein
MTPISASWPASATSALLQIAVATALGAGTALAWGWSGGAALVFGLALSVASTVVLLKALEARGALDSGNGRIAVGWLVVEDMAMVLALVLLPPLAAVLGGGSLALADIARTLGLTQCVVAAAVGVAHGSAMLRSACCSTRRCCSTSRCACRRWSRSSWSARRWRRSASCSPSATRWAAR